MPTNQETSVMKRLLAIAALLGALQMTGAGVASAQNSQYLGEVRNFGYNWCPTGWIQASGQLLSISQNTALFSLYGTYYGGNGVSNFGLPNLNGAAPYGNGNTPPAQPLGAVYGTTTVSVTTANMPQHTHQLIASSAGPTTNSPNGALVATLNANEKAYAVPGSPANVALATGAVGFTGGNQPVYIQSPALAMNWCVAMVGIYPSRN
jgi:microcystin-dependent protein